MRFDQLVERISQDMRICQMDEKSEEHKKSELND